MLVYFEAEKHFWKQNNYWNLLLHCRSAGNMCEIQLNLTLDCEQRTPGQPG